MTDKEELKRAIRPFCRTEKAADNLVDYIIRLHVIGLRESQIMMANNLIDQEVRLYKKFSDDAMICVGIKEMADQVREYYDGGIHATG